MKTYDGIDPKGRTIYFEVSNTFLTRRAACKLASRVQGASIVSEPGFWSFGGEDVFCKFQIDGKQFELWEPFGDSSRFHVAAKPLEPCAALEGLRSVFQQYRPISGIVRWLLLAVALATLLLWQRHSIGG